jgi:hypothetical protein
MSTSQEQNFMFQKKQKIQMTATIHHKSQNRRTISKRTKKKIPKKSTKVWALVFTRSSHTKSPRPRSPPALLRRPVYSSPAASYTFLLPLTNPPTNPTSCSTPPLIRPPPCLYAPVPSAPGSRFGVSRRRISGDDSPRFGKDSTLADPETGYL